MPVTINCPDYDVRPGETFTVTGTSTDPATTTIQASANGASIATSVSWSGNTWTMKVTAPPCVAGGTNIILVTASQGGETKLCEISMRCP